MKLQTPLSALKYPHHHPVTPPPCLRAVLHQTEGIGAITPAYLKPPKCVEQVAHNALLLLFGSRSQDGRFHNAFKWHITGRSLAGLPRTISPGAKEEQQAAAHTFSTKRERGKIRRGGSHDNAQCGLVNHLLTIEFVCWILISFLVAWKTVNDPLAAMPKSSGRAIRKNWTNTEQVKSTRRKWGRSCLTHVKQVRKFQYK